MWRPKTLRIIVDYFLLRIEWWFFPHAFVWVPHDIIIWNIFYWITNSRFSHILLGKHLTQFSPMEYYWIYQLHAIWDLMSQCSCSTPNELYVISLAFCVLFFSGGVLFWFFWFIIGFYFYFHAFDLLSKELWSCG